MPVNLLLFSFFCFSHPVLRAENKNISGMYMRPHPADKVKYIIGGWDPNDNVRAFVINYRSVLQEYLTSEVGHLFNPPISFELVPTDWPELGSDDSIAAETMMDQGALDFVCKKSIFLKIS